MRRKSRCSTGARAACRAPHVSARTEQHRWSALKIFLFRSWWKRCLDVELAVWHSFKDVVRHTHAQCKQRLSRAHVAGVCPLYAADVHDGDRRSTLSHANFQHDDWQILTWRLCLRHLMDVGALRRVGFRKTVSSSWYVLEVAERQHSGARGG